MIRLYDNDSGVQIGSLSEKQLDFLIGQLEEESEQDQDYYIDAATIDLLEEQGADSGLVQLLRESLGEKEGFEIRWSKP